MAALWARLPQDEEYADGVEGAPDAAAESELDVFEAREARPRWRRSWSGVAGRLVLACGAAFGVLAAAGLVGGWASALADAPAVAILARGRLEQKSSEEAEVEEVATDATEPAEVFVEEVATDATEPETAEGEDGMEGDRFVLKADLGELGGRPTDPAEATRKNTERPKLTIESNLKDLLANEELLDRLPAAERFEGKTRLSEECASDAKLLLDEVAKASNMRREFMPEEWEAFQARFASAMKGHCKSATSKELWLEAAGEELDLQKPIMSEALAKSLNKAGLGFSANMHSWLVHESVQLSRHRMGLLPPQPGFEHAVLKRELNTSRAGVNLPDNFQAQEKWGMCSNTILRNHNQGHCGSCWAFGAVGAVEARVCIATKGRFNGNLDMLSRLYTTSCGAHGGDGCAGGWPYFVLDLFGSSGIPSSSCVPYYITGEGTEHFQHKVHAPPCERHCQGGYPSTVRGDMFNAGGVENYAWVPGVHADAKKQYYWKHALYLEGPVPFTIQVRQPFFGYNQGLFSVCSMGDRAEHVVLAFGYGTLSGTPYIVGANSWGPNWGVGGKFFMHTSCMVDFLVPGTFTSIASHPVKPVDWTKPKDPQNPDWPWPRRQQCPFSNGCVSVTGEDYKANMTCISDKLNNKKVKVRTFDTEGGYDILHVNGQSFTGTADRGQVLGLDGLVLDNEGIRFTADHSVQGGGFELCAEE